MALASHLLDGGVVVKTLLLLGLWLAGWGAARLVALVLPGAGMPGEFVATTLAIWNPYVAERLLQGHWSLLVGYGCLPWVATAMLGLRTGGAGFFGLAFFIALAGLTPTGLLLAAAVALACVPVAGAGRRRWVCAAAAIGAAAVAALPWLVAAVTGAALPSHTPANRLGVEAFAPRAEPGLGTLTSLASLGGIWNGDAVPGSRTTLFAVASAVVLLGVVAVGLPAVARRPAAVPLLVLAAAAVLIPAGLATGPGLRLLGAVVDAAPGVGVLRDGQKWVALAVPGYALAGAGAVLTLRRRLFSRRPGAGVLPGADPGAARPGLGRGRQGVAGALPARLAGRRGGDQCPARRGRGAAGRHHAAVLLVGPGAGARPAAPLGARRRAEHRRPGDLGNHHRR